MTRFAPVLPFTDQIKQQIADVERDLEAAKRDGKHHLIDFYKGEIERLKHILNREK